MPPRNSQEDEFDWQAYLTPVEPEIASPPIPDESYEHSGQFDWRQHLTPVDETADVDWRHELTPLHYESVLDRWGITEFIDEFPDLAHDTKRSIGSSYRHMGSSALEAVAEAIEILPFTDPAAASLRETSLEMRDTALKMATELRRIEDPNLVQQAFLTASTSMSVSLPLMVAAAITKHPGLAATAFGGTESLRQYSESRAQGMGKQQALVHATVSGVIESATEFIPFKRFTDLWDGKVGSSIVGRFTKYMAAELVGENIAEVSQRWNDALLGDDEAPDWNEIGHIMALTTLSTFMAAGAQGSLAAGANKLGEYVERARRVVRDPEVAAKLAEVEAAWNEIDRKKEAGEVSEEAYEAELAVIKEVAASLGENAEVRQASGIEEEIKVVENGLREQGILPEDTEGLLKALDSKESAQALKKNWDSLRALFAANPSAMALTPFTPALVAEVDARMDELLHGKGLPQPDRTIEGEVVRPTAPIWERDPDNFSTPKTKAMQRLLETDDRITGLSIEPDGVFIYTDSTKWSDDAGAGTFTGKSETAAIKAFKENVQEAVEPKTVEQTMRESTEFLHRGETYEELIGNYTQAQLKESARSLGLPVSGNKAKLANRIMEELNKEVTETAEAGPIAVHFDLYKGPTRVNVFKNPSIDQLQNLLNKAAAGGQGSNYNAEPGLRWLRDDNGNYYFWDSAYAIHYGMMARLEGILDNTTFSREWHGAAAEDYITQEDLDIYEETLQTEEATDPPLMLGREDAAVFISEKYTDRRERSLLSRGLRGYAWARNNPARRTLGMAGPSISAWEASKAKPVRGMKQAQGFKEADAELGSAFDWMPFTAAWKWVADITGETWRMTKEQRAQAAKHMQRLPPLFVNMARWVGILKESDLNGEFLVHGRVVRIKEEVLNDPIKALEVIMHEYGHALDFWENGRNGFGHTRNSPLYSMDLKKKDWGTVAYESVKAYNIGSALVRNLAIKMGKKGFNDNDTTGDWLTVKDIENYLAENKIGKEQAAYIRAYHHLSYPFSRLYASIEYYQSPWGDDPVFAERRGIKTAAWFQEELFAQHFMLFYAQRDTIETVLPEAATLMRNINEAGNRARSIGEANSRIRAAFQTPSSGTSAAELSEFSRDNRTSLGHEPTGPTVEEPSIQSEPYGSDTAVPGRPKRPEFKPGAIAYDWLAKQFGWRLTLLKKLEDQFAYRVARRRAQAAIKRADKLVRRIGDMFEGLDAETQEAVYQYLTTANVKPTDFIDPSIMVRDRGVDPRIWERGKMVPLYKKARSVKRLIRALGLKLVHAGVLEHEIYEQHKDQYLPQMYLRHILNDDSIRMLASHGKLDLKWALKRNEKLTKLFKQAFLGQVFDPAYLVPMSVGRVARDLAILEFLTEISGNEKWVEPAQMVAWAPGDKHTTNDPEGRWAVDDPMYLNVTPQWLMSEANRMESQLSLMSPAVAQDATMMIQSMRSLAQEARDKAGLRKDFDIKDYVQIPDNASYGPLRGAWVRREIADDLRGALEISMADEKTLAERAIGLDSLQAAHSMFKLNKVALNPPTVFRNIWSNTMLVHISGVSLIKIPKLAKRVAKDYWRRGELYRISIRNGLDASTFTSAELSVLNKKLDEVFEKTHGTPGIMQTIEVMRVISKWLHEIGGNVFQGTEMFGKMIKIADELDRGATEQEAVDEANKWLFDYSEVPRNVEFLRKYPFGAPFATFYYKVIPRVIEVALKYPWRYLPYVSLYYGLQFAASWRLDIDDEDWGKIKRQLPEYVRDGTALLPWPFRDAQGNVQFLDMSYIFPWTMPLELSKNLLTGKISESLESTGLMGGPIPWVWQSLEKNLHPFYETPIYNENDTAAKQFADSLTFIWNQFSPGLLTAEPGNFVYKLLHAYVGQADMYGNQPPTPAQAWTRAAGFNFYAPNRGRNLYFLQRAIEDEIALMKTEMRKAKWPGERDRIQRRHTANIMRMMAEYQQYSEASKVED